MASDLSFFFCFTLLPEENGFKDSISSGSADDTVDGEVVLVLGTGEPEPSTIGVLAMGEIIIGGFVVCSLPKT